MRPLLLLSNDDGYQAPGLAAIREALLPHADVVICAPHSEQSATSHALSLHRPLRLVPHGNAVYSLDGTPADCVYVALHAERRVLPRLPDLVVSGINHGVNLGDDVFYSGTVAAAREAALKGFPALALSADGDASLEAAAQVGAKLALALLREAPGRALLLNANFPAGSRWELRGTRLGSRVYESGVEFRKDPRAREYLWIGGRGASHRPIAGSDTEAFDAGVVGVTPLVLDLWNRSELERVESLLDGVGAE